MFILNQPQTFIIWINVADKMVFILKEDPIFCQSPLCYVLLCHCCSELIVLCTQQSPHNGNLGLLNFLRTHHYIDGLVQERRNSITNVLELRLSYTNSLLSNIYIVHYPVTRKQWHWNVAGCPESLTLNTTAPSQYKDRLSQVWGFPC